MILGIDEVGRGPWAGPLVVGAVILGSAEIEGLNDSKKLTAKRRVELDAEIRDQAAVWALGWVSAGELDELGMSAALRLATRRAVEQVQAECRAKGVGFDEIIIDGTVNFLADTPLGDFVTVMVKADGLISAVSAASIIAKVARDEYMARQDEVYPGYGFASNSGYGVAKHRAAVEQLGVCPEHRLSFAPLAKYRDSQYRPPDACSGSFEKESGSHVKLPRFFSELPLTSSGSAETAAKTTTKSLGDAAEGLVVGELEGRGHGVLVRNWRTRWCEIDIISEREKTLFFTEVKYRKNAKYGGGLAAITAKKQRQMRFAVEFFIAKNPQFADFSCQLQVADVGGQPPEILEIFEIE